MNVWSFEDLDVVTEVDVIDQAAFNMSWLLYQLIKVQVFQLFCEAVVRCLLQTDVEVSRYVSCFFFINKADEVVLELFYAAA